MGKIKTYGLLVIVAFLLIATIYISILLRDESPTAATTIKKTKAASKTYSRTLAMAFPSPTVILTPSATATPTPESFAAAQIPSIITTPTGILLALAPSPTEVVLAEAGPTSSASSTISPTKEALTELPSTGWMKPMHLLFIFAFSLIFFSLIY